MRGSNGTVPFPRSPGPFPWQSLFPSMQSPFDDDAVSLVYDDGDSFLDGGQILHLFLAPETRPPIVNDLDNLGGVADQKLLLLHDDDGLGLGGCNCSIDALWGILH